MDLEFTRRPKKKMIGVRLTDREYRVVKKLAKQNKTSIAETCGVLIRAMLKRI